MLTTSRALIYATAALVAAGIGCGSGGGDTGGLGASTTQGTGGASSQSNGSGGNGQGGDIFSGSGNFVGSGGAGQGGAGGDCTPDLVGVVRDFKAYTNGGHPDFEHFQGSGLKGIVQTQLGDDLKPMYAPDGPTAHTTGKAEFDQWYRDVEGVNKSIPFTVKLTKDANGVATFDSSAFFPVDGQGWGNEGFDHNYGFTFELHMTFKYNGGEIFAFSGDDDLWVFVNKRLAIDLGGLHPPQSDTLDLDAKAQELGIEKGKEYQLDFFHAERHSTGSNFKIQSSLTFTNCDPIIPK
ncbi:fibro-slime domain-containing protein [Polyangium aurulentum]|uniref:fibro-slime domain-containing protein n=1 Tax=Polyangium aurulentum TaxID=2567896 RepID=UPI0010AE37FF|nr:fibro-slime domain-containing protein [Polyangium aurulentum]UQA57288.1 fibro-slime domain-containing protein [Polyangium aurulentum]